MEAARSSGSDRRLPADLAVALAVTGLVNVAAFAPLLRETPLRVPLGLVFLLVVPGYVVVAALFPRGDDLDGVDRLSLSVVASVVVVPAVGLALNLTPWGIRLGPMLVAVSVLVATVAVVAAVARRRVSGDCRIGQGPGDGRPVPFSERARRGVGALRPTGGTDVVLTLSLAAAVALAAGAVGFAVVDHHGSGPAVGEGDDGSGAIALLDSEGDLLTAEASSTPEAGTTESFRVGVDNHGDDAATYTVVALEQELADDGTVADQREAERFEVTVDGGDRAVTEHELEPSATESRLVWLLYPDEVPTELSTETASAYVTMGGSDLEDG